jgi:adenylate cyclase class 2
MSSHSGQENEIKLAVKDAAAARAMLRRAGFHVAKRRVFESNTCFDTPKLALRAGGELLRVRNAGRANTLTYKGPAEADARHKRREELELRLPDASGVAAILDRLGFRPVFRYEKYRTEYRQAGGEGVATLDETPIGVYVELEGAAEWIDRTAAEMGFAESDYITASYAGLYVQWCRNRGATPTHMVFQGRGAGE